MQFTELISSLANFEKTRDRNVFSEYSLEPFTAKVKLFNQYLTGAPGLKISIVGTNGKGSTAHYLAELFRNCPVAGATGLYTSPHLTSQFERVKINNAPVAEDMFDSLLALFSTQEINELKTLSYFEVFTLFAIILFNRNRCNVEIFEAGLGGRLDATRVINPEIVIVTAIGSDHKEILGNTEEDILQEKLGICGTGTKRMFALRQHSQTLDTIIENFCAEKNITLSFFQPDGDRSYLEILAEFSRFIFTHIIHTKFPDCHPDGEPLPPPPGRLEIIRLKPLVIYDTAHNPDAVTTLIASIRSLYPGIVWQAVFACLKDKDLEAMLAIIRTSGIFSRVYLVTGDGFARANEDQLVTNIPLDSIKEIIQPDGNYLSFGSFRIYKTVSDLAD